VKRTVTLEIAGARYRMSSDADEAHLARLADLVNDRIAALGPKIARTTTPQQLLAVVALGLADELVQSEQRRKDVERATVETVGRAIARIDDELGRLRPDGGADGA
jgi:cell division protein ZapA